MDINKRAIIVMLLLAFMAASRADDGVSVGDTPPPLSVDEWIKGEPVTGFEPGRVYLVEFWGTWWGPLCQEHPPFIQASKGAWEARPHRDWRRVARMEWPGGPPGVHEGAGRRDGIQGRL